ncbi:serine/threonine-protein kinase-like protein At3g51990 [Prosopis cineraria]|uniref:serine/threonine-protein kinase-like protein At3g51990 n=1 Tax=Prosopis cineraria TaxID=364024 RepID=UPI00241099E8|nr:serine/threonine-protein kinase-like protein At3g51990 [Prosopis cineraria]
MIFTSCAKADFKHDSSLLFSSYGHRGFLLPPTTTSNFLLNLFPLSSLSRRTPPTILPQTELKFMGFLSCNAKSAIATSRCDALCWDVDAVPKARNYKQNKKLPEIRKFEYSDLVDATNGFSADSFLGKGSHGSVYRATLDDGKLVVAVKTCKFKKSSAKGLLNHCPKCAGCTKCTSPAENEIEILSRIPSSRRIVNLIGFCTDSNLNKLIVVEYMPKGSLHDLLHSSPNPPCWASRVRFALQVAEAVRTLHSSNPPVIHRDIKSSNVLIDDDLNARLGDFGLALRGHEADFSGKCTLPAGTLGYLDPCYLAPGDLSAKSDVFSFGILLLEIISGRNAIDVKYSPPAVVEWAVPLLKQGEFEAIHDPRIGAPSDPKVTEQLAVLAARCVRWKAEKRPPMGEVVECLKRVRKRIRGRPIWSVRRRMGRMEKKAEALSERREEVGRVVKVGNRRNGKVSSVGVVGHEASEGRNDQMVRSKSIGCEGEVKMQCDHDGNGQVGLFVGRKAQARLPRSRSVGVHLKWAELCNHERIDL